jgi:hypothetical protein
VLRGWAAPGVAGALFRLGGCCGRLPTVAFGSCPKGRGSSCALVLVPGWFFAGQSVASQNIHVSLGRLGYIASKSGLGCLASKAFCRTLQMKPLLARTSQVLFLGGASSRCCLNGVPGQSIEITQGPVFPGVNWEGAPPGVPLEGLGNWRVGNII